MNGQTAWLRVDVGAAESASMVTAMIRDAVARAQAESGWAPSGLTLAHPAWWTAAQTQLLVAAAAEAGCPPERLQLLPQPHRMISTAPQFEPSPSAPPIGAPSSSLSPRLALIIAALVVLLGGTAIAGAAVLKSQDSSARSSMAPQYKTIAVGRSQGVGITIADPINHRVYTSDTLDYTVSVVDTVAEKTVATIPLGTDSSLGGMAVDPQNHTLWILSSGTDKSSRSRPLLKVDTLTNKIAGTVNVPANTSDIAVHPRTHEVYISQANGDVVDKASGGTVVATIVDPTTLQTSRIVLPGHGVSLAINPDTGLVYLNGGVSGSVRIIDPNTKTVVGQIDYPAAATQELMVMDPRTNTAYIPSGTGVVVLDLGKGAYVRTIDMGHSVYWMAIDPELGNVYAPDTRGNQLTVLDTATLSIKGTIDMGSSAEGIAADSVSHKVYVRPWDDLSVIDPCTTLQCR